GLRGLCVLYAASVCPTRSSSPVVKLQLHSAGAASRLAALLLVQILPVFSLVAPCQPGASPPSVRRWTLTKGRHACRRRLLSSPSSAAPDEAPRRTSGIFLTPASVPNRRVPA